MVASGCRCHEQRRLCASRGTAFERSRIHCMTAIHGFIEACRQGAHPAVIARMSSGWAVMGERQVLTGYCLLLADPPVAHLNVLAEPARVQFLADMGRLGEAVQRATGALRINYAIFGNLEPALHAHVHPRYVDEPAPMRTANPWSYDWSIASLFDSGTHGPLLAMIRQYLLCAAPLSGVV
jgi:diadenosine tetraphosphate (Ap4A) HIT family hydrolase